MLRSLRFHIDIIVIYVCVGFPLRKLFSMAISAEYISQFPCKTCYSFCFLSTVSHAPYKEMFLQQWRYIISAVKAPWDALLKFLFTSSFIGVRISKKRDL